MELGEILKKIRDTKGLKQEELAAIVFPELEKTKRRQSLISQWERSDPGSKVAGQFRAFKRLLPLMFEVEEDLPSPPCKHKTEQPKDEPAPEARDLRIIGKQLIQKIRRILTNEERKRFDGLLRLAYERDTLLAEEIEIPGTTRKQKRHSV